MKLRRSFLAVVPAVLLLAAACGDGSIKTIDEAATSTPGPGGTAEARFGKAPTLGGNILEVSPKHAEMIRQGATRSPNPNQPQGVCARTSFQGLNGNAQWFRMAIDGVEVTTELVWIIASEDNPTGGIVCFAPAEGITVGDHSAAISVQDPNNPSAPRRQLVAWKFAVIE